MKRRLFQFNLKVGYVRMKKIAMIHVTFGGALVGQLEQTLTAELGPCEFYHVGESRIFSDIMTCGGVTPEIEKRLMPLFEQTQQTGADVAICTCSSIGEIAEKAALRYTDVPILRIDEPASRYAAKQYSHIGLMASVETTLMPSVRLVQRIAEQEGCSLRIEAAVAEGALQKMFEGDHAEYERRVFSTACKLAESCEAILLAQASLSPFQARLEAATGKTFLTTPRLCAKSLRARWTT